MGRHIAFQRWRRWAVILAIFAIGIPVLAAVVIRSSQAHTRLRQLAIDAIRDELGLAARLGPIQLELFPFGVVARDVALDDAVYGRVADADEIRIQPSFGALLRASVDIEAIELSGAHVHLVIRGGQLRNVPRIESGGGGGPPRLPFRRLTIRDSSLSVDAAELARGEVHVDRIEVGGQEGGVIALAIDSDSGFVEHERGRDDIEQLDFDIELSRDAIHVARASVSVGPLVARVEQAQVPLPLPDPRTPGVLGYSGRVELDYELSHLAGLGLPITLPELRGHVSIRASLGSDSTHGQQATGTIELLHGGVNEFGIGDRAFLPFEIDQSAVRIRGGEVKVVGQGGRVGIEATLGLSPALPLDARVTLTQLSFAHLMEQLGVTPNSLVEWIFEGTMVLRGSLRDLDVEGPIDLRTHDFLVNDGPYHRRPLSPILRIPHGHFRGRWSIRNDAVRFSNLDATLPNSHLTGDVLLGFKNELGVQVHVDRGDLRDASPLARLEMAGLGSATCTIDGTYQSPRVLGHLHFTEFRFDTFRLGEVEGDALLDRDGMAVTFSNLVGSKNESRYSAENLRLDFHDQRFRMSLGLGLNRMSLADFYRIFGFETDERFAPYQGVLIGAANVSYSRGYPGDSRTGTLDVDLQSELRDANLLGFGFSEGSLDARFRWFDWSKGMDRALLSLRHLELRKGRGGLAIHGEMSEGGQLHMNAVANGISLAEVEGIGDRIPGLDGVLGVTANIHGTFDRMKADAGLTLANVVARGQSLGDGRFFVRLTQRDDPWASAALSEPEDTPCVLARRGLATAAWAPNPPIQTRDGPEPSSTMQSGFVICGSALDGRMTLDLLLGQQRFLPLRGRVAVDALDLTRLISDASEAPATRGKISAEVRVDDGGVLAPETLSASLRISDVEFGRGDFVVRNDGPLAVTLADGVASIERAQLLAPGSRVRFRGQYALPNASEPNGLAVSASGDVDLSIVSRIAPAVTEASGRVRAQVSLSGPLLDPEFYGGAELSGGALVISGVPTPLEELAARVTFSARSVLIEDVRARASGGGVHGHGQAAIEAGSLTRLSLDLEAEDLVVAPVEGVDSTLGAAVQLAWNRGDRLPRLTGEVRIARMEYSRPIDLAVFALGSVGRASRADATRYDPAADRLAIDVRIVDEHPFVLRNNLIEAEVHIDASQGPLRVVGTDQRFGLLGTLALSRGRVFFRNAVFDLTRGVVTFEDETRINPRFELRAETEITRRTTADLSAPRWRVILDARGTADELRIDTSSDPELPQADILMLLAVGMTRSELAQLGAGAGSAALEALSTVTGVDREVRRAVPIIDDFRIGSGYSPSTGAQQTQVSVGRRLSDRVRISATTGLGATTQRDFRAILDARLTDQLGVQCSYDSFATTGNASSFGNVGCDLRFRLEFE